MAQTTIAIDEGTRDDLKEYKVHENESYNDVIVRLMEGEMPDNSELVEELRSELGGESDPVDYAEIESRVERVMERMVR